MMVITESLYFWPMVDGLRMAPFTTLSCLWNMSGMQRQMSSKLDISWDTVGNRRYGFQHGWPVKPAYCRTLEKQKGIFL